MCLEPGLQRPWGQGGQVSDYFGKVKKVSYIHIIVFVGNKTFCIILRTDKAVCTTKEQASFKIKSKQIQESRYRRG